MAVAKRALEEEDSLEGGADLTADQVSTEQADDSDDEGPMPAPSVASQSSKKRRIVPHEKAYLEGLPTADRYYRSFMHRDTVALIAVTPSTNFILTASVDGHLKFWKKQPKADKEKGEPGIEFVKHYKAHLAPILALVISVDGLVAATIAADGSAGDEGGQGSVKVFDVENFDMINIITLSFVPQAACWIHGRAEGQTLLAISEAGSHKIHIFDGRGDGKPLRTADKIHRAPVQLIAYNAVYDTVVSADETGMIEYWRPTEPFEAPADIPGLWAFKSATDLYEFKKSKALPVSLTFNPSCTHFVTTSLPTDRQVRIFNFLTGKLHRKYDESLQAIQDMQQAASRAAASGGVKLDDMEFGRRLAQEKELERSDSRYREKAVWDESGIFLLYPSLLGIKVVNTVTNKVARILGKDENSRFLNLSLFQGTAEKEKRKTRQMAVSENPLLNKVAESDPILFCTGFKRSRFYLFGQQEPENDANSKGFDRDVFNEKPTREEQMVAAIQPSGKGSRTANFAIIHTDKGDIHLRLFPDIAPKAVENFVVHSREGYYDGHIFHRVIKKFMIQTGDPLGDGTGGDSIWGESFADEFSPNAKHDRPYALSMANAGPKTNGSQFFITCIPCPWLDNKHTIFGRAVAGLEVVHEIENVKCDKSDKPIEDIRIINIDTNSAPQ